jgi:REP element-mobilizing transposase RayT
LPGGFYHTTLRGNHRENIFAVTNDRLLLNKIVEEALARYGARIHAYCWMTNHLHLLVQVGNEPLSRVMQKIASGYARAFQVKRETTGHLFENRFYSVLVDADAYLLELIRYIHLNPLRAQLVSDLDRYRWSSHHAYLARPLDSWVTTEFGLRMFAADRRKAIELYARFVDCKASDISSPLENVRMENPEILGNDDFCRRVHQQLNLPPPEKSFDMLIDEGCIRFGLARHQLFSMMRNDRIAAARAWIARQAMESRVATMTGVARRLGCDPQTIRRALERDENHLMGERS